LFYSTYLGGGSNEQGTAIAADASGSAYVTRITLSTNFPTVNAFQPASGLPVFFASFDAFAAKINNTSPSGGRAMTIGFWKNWASCTTSSNNKKPTIDQTPAAAGSTGEVVSAQNPGSGYPAFAPTIYLRLLGSTATLNSAPDCSKAVNLLNKTTIDGKTRNSNDPAFNLAAQLLATELNFTAGAAKNGTVLNSVNQAVLLLGKYNFNGLTHDKISAADTTTMNNLATILDNYNNTP